MMILASPPMESIPQENGTFAHPAINCSNKIFPCASLWVGLEPERCEEPGGVGTCCGNETLVAPIPALRVLEVEEGPPKRDRRALCLSAAVAFEAEADEVIGSSVRDITDATGDVVL